MVFFNPSLRTRLSTQKAAYNLGMNVLVINVSTDGWQIEMEDGAIMNQGTQEHIKEAIKVVSAYCDIIGVRTFAKLQNLAEDGEEKVLQQFLKYADVPVISLESTSLHPLQSLADLVSIAETKISKPKVVLSWAPHPKALPHAVANSFLEWIKSTDAEVTVCHPEGYELNPMYTAGLTISHSQESAFKNADFIYCKSWSSSKEYGSHIPVKGNWMIDQQKMALGNNTKFMHCLPIRRNVVASDEVIDHSMVYQQAANRLWAAQAVLSEILES